MEHDNLGIVIILTFGFALATFFAYIPQRLKLSPIPGYLLAGYIIGPYSPGFVADSAIAEQLAEIGVILMLFGVGLHFKLEDLINVKNIAIPGAVGQTLIAAVASTTIVYFAGWPLETGIIIGLSIGVASTVVLVRVLMDNHLLNTPEGNVTVGWLVVEDIMTVMILIMLPTLAAFAGGTAFSFIGLFQALFIGAAKFFILALFMFTWGHKIVAYILTNIARLRSQELFTLAVIALIFLIATGSTLIFGISIGLGAFIAGMVIGKTNVRHQAASNSLPLKDIFAIIFFLSVGMIFNPQAIANNFWLFMGLLGIVLLIKPISAYLITVFLGYSMRIALTAALALAQIGEFSFILAEEALKLHLLPEDGYDLLVACALISISLNPMLFRTLGFLEGSLQKVAFLKKLKSKSPKKAPPRKDIAHRVIVVGYGPIGRSLTGILKNLGYLPMVIEQNIDTVDNKEDHESIIFGNANDPNILQEAHINEATHLLITIPDTSTGVEIIEAARQENPAIKIITRARFLTEKPLLEELKVYYICTENEALKAYNSLVRQLFKTVS